MSITIKSVYHDTWNFFRNYFTDFLLIALLCALVTLTLTHTFSPRKEQIIELINSSQIDKNMKFFEIFENMSSEKKQVLLRTSTTSVFSFLIGNSVLIGSQLLLIKSILNGQRVSVWHSIIASAPLIPKLFVLIFITTILVQIGIILLVIPTLPLAIILSFSPIILVQDKVGVFIAIHNSAKLAWKNVNLVSPAILLWMLAKILFLLLLPNFTVPTLNYTTLVINTLNNLIFELLLIYLFRLYMLIHQ